MSSPPTSLPQEELSESTTIGPAADLVASGSRSPAIEVHYLNLDKRPDRDERFRSFNTGLAPLRRVSAVDGKSLDPARLVQEGIISPELDSYSPGALGNALSHRRLWKECVQADRPFTIAEDDAVLIRRFDRRAEAVISRLAEWDVVLWGWNFDSVLHVQIVPGLKQSILQFDPRPLAEKLPQFQENEYESALLPLATAFGLACYSISPRGARRLLERCFPLRKEAIHVAALGRTLPNYTLDAIMNKHYGSIASFACVPPLAWTENDHGSSDVVRT